MSSQTFKLDLKNNKPVIPREAIEYLNQCQGEIEVSLTIQSTDAKSTISSPSSQNSERDFQAAWNCWLAEVEQLEPSPSKAEPNEYGKELIEKYRKQGLEL